MDDVLALRLENKRAIHRYRIFSDRMTNLITHIDTCLLKWIWFNTNRRYKWHCCLLLFGVTNNRVYNDAFRTFTFFNAAKCIVYIAKNIRIILIILDFKLGTIDNRKDYLQTWEEFFLFIIIIIFIFLDKNRKTGFFSRHLLRLQKLCMNSRFRTAIFWIQWYRFDFAFILVIYYINFWQHRWSSNTLAIHIMYDKLVYILLLY